MTTALGVWRYLLRNGQFINAQIQLAQKHLFRYVTKDGSVIFALLSSEAERLLNQLMEIEVPRSADRPRKTASSQRKTSRKPSPITDLSLMHHLPVIDG